jgi:inorganic pyrophosphatase
VSAVYPADFPASVEVVIEIPRGSRNKYEFDEATGAIRLDRVLSAAVFYPHEYGFVDGTRAGAGDHTDAIVLLDEPTFPGCRLRARPVGVLVMHDDKGADDKVLCVALGDPHWAHVQTLSDVFAPETDRGGAFLRDVQAPGGRERRSGRLGRMTRAKELLMADRARFEEHG